MRKNQIKNLQKTDDTFVADNCHLLHELAGRATKEEIALRYDRFFKRISNFLAKYYLRLDVGWTPPDHMFFLQPDLHGTVRLCEYNKGSPEPVDVFEVVDYLFPPKDILSALISALSDMVKHNERILKDLDLVIRSVDALQT